MIFYSEELKSSKQLQYLYWVILSGFFLSFRLWSRRGAETIDVLQSNKSICPPYFQNCIDYAFFQSPADFGFLLVYAILFALMAISAIFAIQKRWNLALGCMIPLIGYKVLGLAVFSYSYPADFEYFHLPIALIFIFGRQKLLFSQLALTLIYFSTGFIKICSTWIAGTYFTSLIQGMPFISNELAPLATNLVIFAEFFLSWALLYSKKWRNAVLGFWFIFHIYSILLVGFHYPSYCLPMVLVLFYKRPLFELPKISFSPVVIAGLITVMFIPKIVTGDFRYTMETFKFGVEMFYANSQCYVSYTLHGELGDVRKIEKLYSKGFYRCYPYRIWWNAKNRNCKQNKSVKNLVIATAIDGGAFYKVVDLAEVCDSDYKFMKRNEWIKDPQSGAPIIGYSTKNRHDKNIFQTKEAMIFDTPQVARTSIQKFILNHLFIFRAAYYIIWSLTFIFGILNWFYLCHKESKIQGTSATERFN